MVACSRRCRGWRSDRYFWLVQGCRKCVGVWGSVLSIRAVCWCEIRVEFVSVRSLRADWTCWWMVGVCCLVSHRGCCWRGTRSSSREEITRFWCGTGVWREWSRGSWRFFGLATILLWSHCRRMCLVITRSLVMRIFQSCLRVGRFPMRCVAVPVMRAGVNRIRCVLRTWVLPCLI